MHAFVGNYIPILPICSPHGVRLRFHFSILCSAIDAELRSSNSSHFADTTHLAWSQLHILPADLAIPVRVLASA